MMSGQLSAALALDPCESNVAIGITRLDGTPFPPVEVTWRAMAGARVAFGEMQTADVRLALEVDAP